MTTLAATSEAFDASDLLDQLPIGICLVDSELRVISWNRTLENWTRHLRGQAVGATLTELFPGADQQAIFDRVRTVLETGRALDIPHTEHTTVIPIVCSTKEAREKMLLRTTVCRHEADPEKLIICITNVASIVAAAVNNTDESSPVPTTTLPQPLNMTLPDLSSTISDGERRRPPPNLLSGRILLVEDDIDNQRVIAYFLQNAGANVDIANDGMHALELIEKSEAEQAGYDFVLMDMQMPRMDGYEATQAMRQRGFKKPIVAITAYVNEYDHQHCRDAGCDEYATKPIQRKTLIDLASRHLNPSRTGMGGLTLFMPE